jgi:hypothetical protein
MSARPGAEGGRGQEVGIIIDRSIGGFERDEEGGPWAVGLIRPITRGATALPKLNRRSA